MTEDKIHVEEILNYFWSEGDLEYKLDDLQVSISDRVRSRMEKSKKICVLSSRQVGKSYWVMVFAVEYLIKNPKSIVRVIAPTKDKCDEIVEDNLNVIFNDVPKGMVAKSTAKNRWNFFNGSSLRLGALERQYVDKNRGGNAAIIIYEECGFVKGEDFNYGVNSVIGPQLLRSKGWEIFVSSPSEQPDHPLHTEVMPLCKINDTLFRYSVFRSPTITNEAIIEAARRSGTELTLQFVDEVRSWYRSEPERDWLPEIKKLAEAHKIYLSDGFRREFLAEIIRPTSLMIIPVFHEKKAVFDFKLPNHLHSLIVTDWGGVRDKTVSLYMAYDYCNDRDLVIDEKVWEANTPTNEIVDSLKAWEFNNFPSTHWADVPGQLQVDLIQQYKYNVNIPPKNNWLSAVNSMAARFAENRVYIHPRCRFLIATIEAGMFNKTRTDFDRTETLGHMDALAALMYGIRCQNKENPNPLGIVAQKTSRFEVHKDEKTLSDIAPKRFGSGKKKFGSFDT